MAKKHIDHDFKTIDEWNADFRGKLLEQKGKILKKMIEADNTKDIFFLAGGLAQINDMAKQLKVKPWP